MTVRIGIEGGALLVRASLDLNRHDFHAVLHDRMLTRMPLFAKSLA